MVKFDTHRSNSNNILEDNKISLIKKNIDYNMRTEYMINKYKMITPIAKTPQSARNAPTMPKIPPEDFVRTLFPALTRFPLVDFVEE